MTAGPARRCHGEYKPRLEAAALLLRRCGTGVRTTGNAARPRPPSSTRCATAVAKVARNARARGEAAGRRVAFLTRVAVGRGAGMPPAALRRSAGIHPRQAGSHQRQRGQREHAHSVSAPRGVCCGCPNAECAPRLRSGIARGENVQLRATLLAPGGRTGPRIGSGDPNGADDVDQARRRRGRAIAAHPAGFYASVATARFRRGGAGGALHR